jgi:hypothetical protein
MSSFDDKILRKVSPVKIILPIFIGLGIVVYLIYRDWNGKAVSSFSFTPIILLFLLFSICMMALRDIGYMIRLRILSEGKLSWKKIFYIIMLWEFASTVLPSAVGGTTVATYFIYKEGLSLGKSTALVIATAFLDELYFIILFPMVIFMVGFGNLFSDTGHGFGNNYVYFAFTGYGLKLIFDIFIAYGLFKNPIAIKNILMQIFKLRFLKKWKEKAANTGDDIVLASNELKGKPFFFWMKAFFATFISWTARNWIVNFLLLGLLAGLKISYHGISLFEHFEIFARQLVMWIMMLVMPSPGASGFAEAVFSDYLSVFIPIGFIAMLAFAWRAISYYPYLFIGVFILPLWIKRTHAKKQTDSVTNV